MLGQDPGQSSLIEVRIFMERFGSVHLSIEDIYTYLILYLLFLVQGFTAGGFVYIAVAGVLAEMNNGSSSIKSTALQLTSLILGMSVALCISLVE